MVNQGVFYPCHACVCRIVFRPSGRLLGSRSLQYRILLPMLAIVVLSTASVVAYTVWLVHDNMTLKLLTRDIETAAAMVDTELPGPWEVRAGRLYKGRWQIDGNGSLPLKVKRVLGYETTVFLGDRRVATTICVDGRPITGTRAASCVTEQVLVRGQPYIGRAGILGCPYYTAYKPVAQGKQMIGMFFTGRPAAEVDAAVLRAVWPLILIGLALTGLDRFYMAGQWVEPGGGLPPAAMSGRDVIRRICQRNRRPFVTTAAPAQA